MKDEVAIFNVFFDSKRKPAYFKTRAGRVIQQPKKNNAVKYLAMPSWSYCLHFHILFWLLTVFVTPDINAQEAIKRGNEIGLPKLQVAYDSVRENLHIVEEVAYNTVGAGRLDSIGQTVDALEQSIRQRIDSLAAMGFSSDSLHAVLQNLLNSPNKLHDLLAFDKPLNVNINEHVLVLDTLTSLQNLVQEKVDGIQEISTDLGIGPLAKDLIPKVEAPGLGLPSALSAPDLDVPTNENALGVSNPNFDLPETPDADIKDLGGKLTKETTSLAENTSEITEEITEKTSEVTDVVKKTGEVLQDVNEYKADVKKAKEEGLLKSEMPDELAEKEALRIDELRAFKEQNKGIDEVEAYKKLIEQYRDEKRIESEMTAKVKELANDIVFQNNAKVSETMKRISRYKRKFPDVADLRNLPKHAPNPLSDLKLRERVFPGLTLQTINNKKVWLELDPQLYYRFSASVSAGVGGMYRLSMNPGKMTFDDFGSMYGGKAFTQYSVCRGFFLRGEVQLLKWKPWRWSIADPRYVDRTCVGAVGVGKSYMIARKIKGSAQTLYHWHWRGLDPYQPRIMVRLGFDLSLEKKKEKPWAKKLKELKNK